MKIYQFQKLKRPYHISLINPHHFAVLQEENDPNVVFVRNKKIYHFELTSMGINKIDSIALNNRGEIVIPHNEESKLIWLDKNLNISCELSLPSKDFGRIKSISKTHFGLLLRDKQKIISFRKENPKSYKVKLEFQNFPDLKECMEVVSGDDKLFFFLAKDQCSVYLLDKRRDKASIKKFLGFGRGGKGKIRNATDINFFKDKIVINDNDNYLIQIFDQKMNFIKQFGGKGSSRNRFDLPVSANVFNQILFICDKNNDRVLFYEEDSIFFKTLIKRKFQEGILSRPSSLAFAGNNLLVSDRSNNVVQVFNKKLEFIRLLQFPDKIKRPASISVFDSNELFYVYILERREFGLPILRLFKFDKNLQNCKPCNQFKLNSVLGDPQDMDIDSNGNLIIANTLERSVLVLDKKGKKILNIDLSVISGDPRILIKSVFVDKSDNSIFAGDFEGKRIFSFDSMGKYKGVYDFSHVDSIDYLRTFYIHKNYIILSVRGRNELILSKKNDMRFLKPINAPKKLLDWNHPTKIISYKGKDLYIADKENDRIVTINISNYL